MNTPVARPTFALIGVAGYIARRHLEVIREAGGTLMRPRSVPPASFRDFACRAGFRARHPGR
jgi:hypothetical protein